MRRQQLLTQAGAPELRAVLDEAALRRPPDGPKVLRAQLEHLLQITELPNVTLQIVPFHAGLHAAAVGPFIILRFPEPDLPDLVYPEQLNGALHLDQPVDVMDYVTVMDRLCVRAGNRRRQQRRAPRSSSRPEPWPAPAGRREPRGRHQDRNCRLPYTRKPTMLATYP
jgi:hypothetical protein